MRLPDPSRGRREEVHKVRRQKVHKVKHRQFCRREPTGGGGWQDKARSFATRATFVVHGRGWDFHYRHDEDTAVVVNAVWGIPGWQLAAFMGPGRCNGRDLL